MEDVAWVNSVETLVVVEEVQVNVEFGLASSTSFDLKLFFDLLELRAHDGLFIFVVEAEAGFTEQMIDEFLGVTRVKREFKDLSQVRTNGSVKTVVKVRGDERLESREESLVEDVA